MLLDQYHKANVLITGGLGFIGSSLAIKLVQLGANVVLMDAMIPDYGGNLYNIEPVRDQVIINYSDIRDEYSMNYLVQGKDYIFHLAGQNCHVTSLSNPFPDIDMNIKGTAVLMEACKKHNPYAKVIYTGTRGVYGSVPKLPVSEDAPTNPKGIYEISNLTAEKIIKVYNDIHGIKSVLLRLTNIYGERAQMKHHRFGVANWFIRLAIDNQTIRVFGDGKILRDFLYIDDCVNAMLLSGVIERCYGEVLNVGVDQPTSFRELVESIISIAESGNWEFAPFSQERAAQEPGDFYSDITKIKTITGWQPIIGLNEGLNRTIKYYAEHKKHYWSEV